MTQQFSKTDEPWSRIQPFFHDGVEIHVMTYAHADHSAATTVFFNDGSEVFHADKHCHRLHQSEPRHGEPPTRMIYAETLEDVMTTWLNPVRPCDYCTQDIHRTAEIVKEFDGVPESCLKYFEPGDEKVTRQVHTDPETGETTVRESSTEVY